MLAIETFGHHLQSSIIMSLQLVVMICLLIKWNVLKEK